MKKELFYVAASRGREGLAVVTSDKARLQETIGCSMERESATEPCQPAPCFAKGRIGGAGRMVNINRAKVHVCVQ
jgi:hypothetical protein